MPEEIKVMTFGRHRGRPLTEVPLPYLYWALRAADSMTEEMRENIELELERRTGRIPSKRLDWWLADR